jgi:hypothetical protein
MADVPNPILENESLLEGPGAWALVMTAQYFSLCRDAATTISMFTRTLKTCQQMLPHRLAYLDYSGILDSNRVQCHTNSRRTLSATHR